MPYRQDLSQAEIALFRSLLAKHRLEPYEALIAPWLERCIGILKDGEDDYSLVGNSRLAGLPDLAVGQAWPSRRYDDYENPLLMTFAGQFNLAELAPYQSQLPRQGLLSVFLDTDPYESQSCLLNYQGPLNRLQRYPLDPQAVQLGQFDTELVSVSDLPIWLPQRVRFQGGLSIPAYQFRLYDGLFCENFELGDRYLELQGDLRGHFEHSLFLHPFYQGEDPRDLGDPEPQGAPRGVNLFCFESDEELGFAFGAYGCKQIVIDRQQLLRHDFSQIYTTEQGV